jgi:stage II sporulation protein GA (sporulation sigma-E factor processing peptidase)
MTVYADVVFFLNSAIDFLLLWLTSGIRKQKAVWWRLLLSALLGGFYSMLHLWPQFSIAYFLPVKIIVSFFMVWIAFGWKDPLAFFRNLGMFYLICFITGGAMIAFHYVMTGDSQVAGGIFYTESQHGWGSPVSWGLIIFGFPVVWLYTRLSLRSLDERQMFHQFTADVKIRLKDQELRCVGLVDTGNQLRDPITRAPVIMVELEQLKPLLPEPLWKIAKEPGFEKDWDELPADWMNRIRLIPYRAAGTKNNLLMALKPDYVIISQGENENKIKKILIGIDVGSLSSDGTYQAIIHPSCVSAV